MKKLFVIVLTMALLFCLSGCKKCIDESYSEVSVKVVNEYYHDRYMTPVLIGNRTSFMWHPASYKITVEYNDIEYVLNSEAIYKEYKNKVGETVTGVLCTYLYDDGSVKYDVVNLK